MTTPTHTPTSKVRFGVLGAASIAPSALLEPVRRHPHAEVVCVAARDRRRAEAFAQEQGIARIHDSYQHVVDDPDVDAVYVPLPNGLHGLWAMRALGAGKHVLCEKPFAANADEAALMVDRAREAGLVLMEAFHYAYHPLTRRWLELVRGGLLGSLRDAEASFCTSIPSHDVRYRFDLAGGALMDLGCYCIHALRSLSWRKPTVIRAEAQQGPPGVDRALRATLDFEGDLRAELVCDMGRAEGFAANLRIVGAQGTLEVHNPFVPHLGHRLRLTTATGQHLDEQLSCTPSYDYQLLAFMDAIRSGCAPPTGGADAVSNLQAIDQIYVAAGLVRRQPCPT